MKNLFCVLICMIFLFACQQDHKQRDSPKEFNQALADQLARRANLDQTAAGVPPEKYKTLGLEKWRTYKDSVFRTNQVFLERVLNDYGFPGIDLVGEQGTFDYWLMVQHCDFDPDFQKRVLALMKIEVAQENAIPRNYGLLFDRVQLNTGKKQVYGTQVRYHKKTGQAYPKPLKDSMHVNQRREAVGLDPLEVYLNRMTLSHFEMNKENMMKRGIQKPSLYVVNEKE